MAKKLSGPQVITANHLRGGDVVYYAQGGQWSVWIDDALVAHSTEAAEALLQDAKQSVAAGIVVEPFLIEVEPDEESGRIVPSRYREKIRAAGPSTHPAFGKQAGQHASLELEDVSHAYANGV